VEPAVRFDCRLPVDDVDHREQEGEDLDDDRAEHHGSSIDVHDRGLTPVRARTRGGPTGRYGRSSDGGEPTARADVLVTGRHSAVTIANVLSRRRDA
jgi:hypothetical protein